MCSPHGQLQVVKQRPAQPTKGGSPSFVERKKLTKSRLVVLIWKWANDRWFQQCCREMENKKIVLGSPFFLFVLLGFGRGRNELNRAWRGIVRLGRWGGRNKPWKWTYSILYIRAADGQQREIKKEPYSERMGGEIHLIVVSLFGSLCLRSVYIYSGIFIVDYRSRGRQWFIMRDSKESCFLLYPVLYFFFSFKKKNTKSLGLCGHDVRTLLLRKKCLNSNLSSANL